MRRLLTLAVVFGVLFSARDARADLKDDALTLLQSYRRAGARVRRAAPWFMIRDEVRALGPNVLPAKRRGRCLAIVALAERTVSFRFEAKGPVARLDSPRVRESEAGVARLEDCRGRLSAEAARLRMASPRGAVELLVVEYDKALPEVEDALPARAVGPVAPRGRLGEPLALAPVKERLERAESAARQDGARAVVRVAARADDRGAGALLVKLSEGCHRLSVHADVPANNAAVDVDAEVQHRGAEQALARDRSHAPDARLEFCLGEAEPLELRFAGAGGAADVFVVDAHWPLPEGVPSRWGKEAQGRLAWALFRRHAPRLAHPPTFEALGASGVTHVPFAVEPGACYVAAFALTRGEASNGTLTLRIGPLIRNDDTDTSASLSFCAAPNEHTASFEVAVPATQNWWVLAVWRLASREAATGAAQP